MKRSTGQVLGDSVEGSRDDIGPRWDCWDVPHAWGFSCDCGGQGDLKWKEMAGEKY